MDIKKRTALFEMHFNLEAHFDVKLQQKLKTYNCKKKIKTKSFEPANLKQERRKTNFF